jgi:hypothetical protein
MRWQIGDDDSPENLIPVRVLIKDEDQEEEIVLYMEQGYNRMDLEKEIRHIKNSDFEFKEL